MTVQRFYEVLWKKYCRLVCEIVFVDAVENHQYRDSNMIRRFELLFWGDVLWSRMTFMTNIPRLMTTGLTREICDDHFWRPRPLGRLNPRVTALADTRVWLPWYNPGIFSRDTIYRTSADLRSPFPQPLLPSTFLSATDFSALPVPLRFVYYRNPSPSTPPSLPVRPIYTRHFTRPTRPFHCDYAVSRVHGYLFNTY